MTYPAAAFARELIAALAAQGVTDYVLCPGSRSGPLAHALAEAASDAPPVGAPRVNLYVRIDERSAAFLAIGIARARALTGPPRPVAVITTSGTAVGNLMPAVMEAHHAGIPLLLLTADRPSEVRGTGANQTTDQEGLFGTFARWAANSSAPERADRPVDCARREPRRAQSTGRSVRWSATNSRPLPVRCTSTWSFANRWAQMEVPGPTWGRASRPCSTAPAPVRARGCALCRCQLDRLPMGRAVW